MSDSPVFFRLQEEYTKLCKGHSPGKTQAIDNLEKYFRALNSCFRPQEGACPLDQSLDLHGCVYIDAFMGSLSDLGSMTLDDVIRETFQYRNVKTKLLSLDRKIDRLSSHDVTIQVKKIASESLPNVPQRSRRFGRAGLLVTAILMFAQFGPSVNGSTNVPIQNVTTPTHPATNELMQGFSQFSSEHGTDPIAMIYPAVFSTRFHYDGWLLEQTSPIEATQYTIPLHGHPKQQILEHLRQTPSRYQHQLHELDTNQVQMTVIVYYNDGQDSVSSTHEGITDLHHHSDDGMATLLFVPEESNIPPIPHSRWRLKDGDEFEATSFKGEWVNGITYGPFAADFQPATELDTILNADQSGTEFLPLPLTDLPVANQFVQENQAMVEKHIQSSQVGVISDAAELYLHRGVQPKPGHVRMMVAIVFPF